MREIIFGIVIIIGLIIILISFILNSYYVRLQLPKGTKITSPLWVTLLLAVGVLAVIFGLGYIILEIDKVRDIIEDQEYQLEQYMNAGKVKQRKRDMKQRNKRRSRSLKS